MSWPGSLTAAAITMPPLARSPSSRRTPRHAARCRAATAICQRRTMFSTATRCMFTPIATEASPRARRLEATTRSCTQSTPSPPCSAGIGAAK